MSAIRAIASTRAVLRGRLSEQHGHLYVGHESGAPNVGAHGPTRRWFERRAVVLGTAACLTAVVFVLRALTSSQMEAVGLLYVIPVALFGLELGLRGGAAAVLGTLLLVAIKPPSSDPSVDAIGLVTRGVALLSVGVIAGRFSDRMREAQERLEEQFRSAEHILDAHEQERRGIAEQLHEQAAQTMAATMLIVGRLDREPLDRLTQAQLEEIRQSVRQCIAHLRELAATLRPPVLDELGLEPALERIVEARDDAALEVVWARANGCSERLPPEVETLAYRAIEEAASCMAGAIVVDMAPHDSQLSIRISGEAADRVRSREPHAWLATTRARLEIIGGTLASSLAGERMVVSARIPIVPDARDRG